VLPLRRLGCTALRAVALAAVVLFLTTCTDEPTAPRWGFAKLAIHPELGPGIAPAGNALAVDAIRVQVIRPSTEEIIVDQRYPFDPSASSLQVTVSVPLQSTQETLQVVLDYLSGTSLLYQGSQSVIIQAGSNGNQPVNIPVVYAGPGQTATSVTISPRDTLLTSGDALTFRADAVDNGTPVPVYVGWSTDNGAQAIDANGRIVAAITRGVVKIRVQTPTPPGIKDSTTVNIVPRPNHFVKVSGDGQTGVAGSALAQPLIVQVDGSDNLGIPGVRVTFAAATGGGSVDTATVVTDATGQAGTTVKLGPAVPGQTFTASVTGIPNATFTATATAAGVKTWVGTAGDWNTAANWSPGGVPAGTDDAVIPSGTATLSTAGTAKSVTVNAGASVNLNGFNLSVAGNVFADGTIVGSGNVQVTAAGQIRGSIVSLNVGAPVTVVGTVTMDGPLTITGATANLTLGGKTVGGVISPFTVQNGGVLTMNNGSDQLTVGSAVFNGGDETGKLTNGLLIVGGDFTQSGGATSFVATATHTTRLGTNSQVSFGSPTTSTFGALDVTPGTGGITLNSDVVASGALIGTGGAPILTTPAATPHTLTVGGVNVSALQVDRAPLVINGGSLAPFNNVTFTNSTQTGVQLTVNHPGVVPWTFDKLTFSTTPTTGFYLRANDVDGPSSNNALTINLTNPSPPTPGNFVSTLNGAVVNWGTLPGKSWTGALSTDWNTPGNWNPTGVPTNADDVTIPTGTVTLSNTGSAKSLTVAAGASLNLGAFNLAVGGNVLGDGTISGTGAIQIATTALIRGALPNLQLSGAVTLATTTLVTGNVTVTGATGNLTLGGQAMTVTGNFTVQGGALLTMTNTADVLTIGGNATFNGGNELNSMSAGILGIGGSLSQAGSTDGFHPSGTHTTVFTGASPTITFANPGNVPGSSHFETVSWAGSGTLTLGSDVYAHSTFGVSLAGTIAGNGHKVSVGDFVSGSGTTFDNATLVLDQPAAVPLSLSNVTFKNTAPTATALTVNSPGLGTFTFSNITFNVTPTTGFYLSANDANASDGVPLTIDMVNPTPGTPGNFVQQLNGAVVHWPAISGSPPLRTWTGAKSTDWSDPGNWNPNGVPTTTDSVIIVTAPNMPVVTTASSVGSLVMIGAVSLTMNTNQSLQITGDLDQDPLSSLGILDATGGNGGVALAGTGRKVRGPLSVNVVITGSYSLSGPVVISQPLLIYGSLDLNGAQISVGSNLLTTGSGTLTMTQVSDTLRVAGEAFFGGGSTTGKLTAGALFVNGTFFESGTAADAFAPSLGHWTILSGNTIQDVSFAHPGGAGGTSHFMNLAITNKTTGAVTLASDVFILGQAAFVGVPTQIVSGSGSSVVHMANVKFDSPTTFDGVLLAYDAALGGQLIQLDSLTFINYSTSLPGTPVLSIAHPGFATGPITFNALTFADVIGAGTTNYVSATDSDGPSPTPLTIIITSNGQPGPNEGPPHTVTANGATVRWSN